MPVSGGLDSGSSRLIGLPTVNTCACVALPVVAFGGVGRAAQDFDLFSDATSIVDTGIGFRCLIAHRYGFVMGIDYARGPEDNAFYVQADSAW